jgi:tetratricopeptide (TPR) repeat protein
MAMDQQLEVCLILMHQHRYALAEKEIGRILAEEPYNDRAHGYMAWCMADQWRLKEAMNRANNAIRLDPEEDYNYYIKATCFTTWGQYQKSLEWFRHALRINPNTSFYYSDLSDALFHLGRYPAALRTAGKGLRLYPQDAACHKARAMALKAMGRNAEALVSAEKTLVLDPENAQAFHLKGSLLMEEEKPEEARRVIRESLRLNPINNPAVNDLKLVEEKILHLRTGHLADIFSWLALISAGTMFFTENPASLVAGSCFLFLEPYWVKMMGSEPGSRIKKVMMMFAPFLIMLGVLSVTFFSQAHPWYHDWAAWLFAILFCVLCVNPEAAYFSEERGFDPEALAWMVEPLILFVSLFFLNPAGVMLGINGALLIGRFDFLNKTRPGRWFKFQRFLRFLSVPFIVWFAGSIYWDWLACTAWYGNGNVWFDEFAYFIFLVWLESGTPNEESSKENEKVFNHQVHQGHQESL